MATAFPATLLDNPEAFADLFGSFWAGTLDGREQFVELMAAMAKIYAQAVQNASEAFDCVDRLRIPVYARKLALPLRILESDRADFPLVYDAGYLYDDGLLYDGVSGVGSTFPFTGVVSAAAVANAPTRATALLVGNVDFRITDDGLIRFLANPFTDARFTPRTLFSDGVASDRELILWLIDAKVDVRYLQSHLGYVLNWRGPSTQLAKDFLNGVFDSVTGATSAGSVIRALTGAAGAAVAQYDGEIVEDVARSATDLIVVTDRNAYLLPPNATALVDPGDVLHACQALCDAVVIHENINRGLTPPVQALSLPLGACSTGEVAFFDKIVPLETDTRVSPPQVTFEIAGAQPAIDAFWAYVRAREAATGKALANYLDVRPNPDGDPTPGSLPATINPLEFACEHLLRRGTFLVEVATGSLRSMAFFDFLPYFRKFLPPGRLMLLVIVLSSVEDSIIMTTDEEVAVEAGVPDIEDASNEPFADAVALAPRASDG